MKVPDPTHAAIRSVENACAWVADQGGALPRYLAGMRVAGWIFLHAAATEERASHHASLRAKIDAVLATRPPGYSVPSIHVPEIPWFDPGVCALGILGYPQPSLTRATSIALKQIEIPRHMALDISGRSTMIWRRLDREAPEPPDAFIAPSDIEAFWLLQFFLDAIYQMQRDAKHTPPVRRPNGEVSAKSVFGILKVDQLARLVLDGLTRLLGMPEPEPAAVSIMAVASGLDSAFTESLTAKNDRWRKKYDLIEEHLRRVTLSWGPSDQSTTSPDSCPERDPFLSPAQRSRRYFEENGTWLPLDLAALFDED